MKFENSEETKFRPTFGQTFTFDTNFAGKKITIDEILYKKGDPSMTDCPNFVVIYSEWGYWVKASQKAKLTEVKRVRATPEERVGETVNVAMHPYL